MIDLIIFSVAGNRYALNIENTQRVIQATDLIDIPNSHKYIDGMMSHEDKVIKILNFRKLIGLEVHVEDSMDIDEYSQKFIIIEKENSSFALKVDSIEDIAHIHRSNIINDTENENIEFLEFNGALELDGVLVNIIKTINLPS